MNQHFCREGLVTSDQVENKNGDGGDGDDYGQEHDGDEPGGSIGRFGRGLSDSKRVNEDIREIKKGFHGFLRRLHPRCQARIYC
jgi:hypothetical protein